MLPLILAVCVLGVFCLAPLALYLGWLGSVNRRPRPTVIGGGWDFAALLAGLSGFVVFGGGVLVAALQSNLRVAYRGNWEQIRDAWGQERVAWAATALGYLLVVAGGVTLVVLSRLRTLSVYNIDRPRLEEAVGGVLAGVGLTANRLGDVWTDARDGKKLVSVDPFQGARHATVRIVCPDPRLAEEIERGLRERLPATPPADRPVAGWFYSASITCFFAVACSMGLIAYFVYAVSR